jgi:hypothetical protein
MAQHPEQLKSKNAPSKELDDTKNPFCQEITNADIVPVTARLLASQ